MPRSAKRLRAHASTSERTQRGRPSPTICDDIGKSGSAKIFRSVLEVCEYPKNAAMSFCVIMKELRLAISSAVACAIRLTSESDRSSVIINQEKKSLKTIQTMKPPTRKKMPMPTAPRTIQTTSHTYTNLLSSSLLRSATNRIQFSLSHAIPSP